MIFPQDVHKLIQDKNRIAGDNKVQLVIVLFVLGNVFGFLGLSLLFSIIIPGAPLSLTITVQGIILAIVGIFVFRFFVFDENAKKREYQGQQSDSFTRYMYIRKDNIRKDKNNVNIFEYTDGSAVFAVEFRFGSNDDSKAAGTRQFYESFMKLVSMYGFESRSIIASEDFRTSKECAHYLDLMNANEDVQMRRTLLMMANAVFDLSFELSNVDKVTFLVRSVYNYQKADLELFLRNFIKLLSDSYTAFRSVEFLDLDSTLELYRNFYGIEAIDLAMMKAISLSEEAAEEFSNVIQIIDLKGTSGKTYHAQKIDKLVQVKEQKLN